MKRTKPITIDSEINTLRDDLRKERVRSAFLERELKIARSEAESLRRVVAGMKP